MVEPSLVTIVSPASSGGRRVVGVPPLLVGVSMSSTPELQGQAYLVHNVFYERDGTDEGGVPPASKTSIAALKEVESGEECVICLETMEAGGKEMPCGHQFHRGCVEKWLRIHGSCPLCRYQMPKSALEEEVVLVVGEERAVMRGRRVVLSVLLIGPLRDNGDGSEQETPSVLIDELD